MKLKFVVETVFRDGVYCEGQIAEFSDADGKWLVSIGKAKETAESVEEKKIVKKAKAEG